MMRVFWDAVVAVDQAAGGLGRGRSLSDLLANRPPACFQAAGFGDVEVSSLDCEMAFANFDDYWTLFLGAQGASPWLPDVAKREQSAEAL